MEKVTKDIKTAIINNKEKHKHYMEKNGNYC